MFEFLKREKNKKQSVNQLVAFVSGSVLPIEEAGDEVFSSKMMGNGLVIEPSEDLLLSPAAGTVSMVMPDSFHAVAVTDANGMEIMLHVGLDTVTMNGDGFEVLVKEGDMVKAGQPLMRFSRSKITERGLSSQIVMIITNTPQFEHARFYSGMDAVAGKTVIAEYNN